jgi:hypothetical protein
MKLGEIAFRYNANDCFLLSDSWFTNVLLGVTFLASISEAVGISLSESLDYQPVHLSSMV